jgi:hypothetical protein
MFSDICKEMGFIVLIKKKGSFEKTPSIFKEVALYCGIASRSNPTYLPFLSLMIIVTF